MSIDQMAARLDGLEDRVAKLERMLDVLEDFDDGDGGEPIAAGAQTPGELGAQ